MAVVAVYSITAAILLAYFASYIYKAVAAVVAAVARSIIYIIVLLLLLDKIMLVSELLRLLFPFYCCKSHKIMQNLITVSYVASAITPII